MDGDPSVSTYLQQKQLGWPLGNGSHKLQVFGSVETTGTQSGPEQMHHSLVVTCLKQPLNLLQGLASLQGLQVLINLKRIQSAVCQCSPHLLPEHGQCLSHPIQTRKDKLILQHSNSPKVV